MPGRPRPLAHAVEDARPRARRGSRRTPRARAGSGARARCPWPARWYPTCSRAGPGPRPAVSSRSNDASPDCSSSSSRSSTCSTSDGSTRSRLAALVTSTLGLRVADAVADPVVAVEHRHREQDRAALPGPEERGRGLGRRGQQHRDTVALLYTVRAQDVREPVRELLQLAPVDAPDRAVEVLVDHRELVAPGACRRRPRRCCSARARAIRGWRQPPRRTRSTSCSRAPPSSTTTAEDIAPGPYSRPMDVLLGVLLGVVLTASAVAIGRLAAPRRVLAPGEEGVRAALHAAAATLPHFRRGLTRESAGKAIGHLHALTQAAGVLIDDGETVLAADGIRTARPPARVAAGLHARRGRTRPGPVRQHGGRAARGRRRADRPAGRLLRPGTAAAPRGHARGLRGGQPRVRPGRAVRPGGAGGAPGAGRAAGPARADLAALHLQRARRGREQHPHPARRRRASC